MSKRTEYSPVFNQQIEPQTMRIGPQCGFQMRLADGAPLKRRMRREALEAAGVIPNREAFGNLLQHMSVVGLSFHQVSALAKRLPDDPGATDARSPRGLWPWVTQARGAETIGPAGSPCVVRSGDWEALVAGGGALAFAISATLLADTAEAGFARLLDFTVSHIHHEDIAAALGAGGVLMAAKSPNAARLAAASEALEFCGARFVHWIHGRT